MNGDSTQKLKVSKSKYILVSLFMGEVLAKAGSTLFLAWRGGSTSVAVKEANKIMRNQTSRL